jgi:hypothetical protein
MIKNFGITGKPKKPEIAKRCYGEFLEGAQEELRKREGAEVCSELIERFIQIISSIKN